MRSGQEMENARTVSGGRGGVGDVVAGLAVVMGGVRFGFRVDWAVIPVGIRCEVCGVCHLPASVIAERGANPRDDEVVRLRCPRCSAVGEVALNGGPQKADLLDVLGVDWRDGGSVDASAG